MNQRVRVVLAAVVASLLAAGLVVAAPVSAGDGPAVSIGDQSGLERDSVNGSVFMPVFLSEAASEPVVVAFHTVDGTAVAGVDYLRWGTPTNPRTVTIPAGAVQTTINVPLLHADTDPVDKQFTVVLSSVSGGDAVIGRSTGTATIIDSDAAFGANPLVNVSNPTVVEGDDTPRRAQFLIHLSRPTAAPLTVSYSTVDGTAVAGVDYTAKLPGTVVFAPGQISKTIDVLVTPNTTVDSTRSFTLDVTITGGSSVEELNMTGTATILDDDTTVDPGGGSTDTLDVGDETITLEGPVGSTVSLEQADQGGDLPAAPDELSYRFGALDIRIEDIEPGSIVTVELSFSSPVDVIRKLIDGEWHEFLDDGETGAILSEDGRSVTMRLQDGGRGDADGVANGVIIDPLAPADAASLLVTTTEVPIARIGVPFEFQLEAAGAASEPEWSLTDPDTDPEWEWLEGSASAVLPDGLELSSDGVISGTPAGPSSAFPVLFRVYDGAADVSITKLLPIIVRPAGFPYFRCVAGAGLPDGNWMGLSYIDFNDPTSLRTLVQRRDGSCPERGVVNMAMLFRTNQFGAVQFDPQGRWYINGRWILSLNTAAVLGYLSEDAFPDASVTISPDGSRVVVDGKLLRTSRAGTLASFSVIRNVGDWGTTPRFSSDSRYVMFDQSSWNCASAVGEPPLGLSVDIYSTRVHNGSDDLLDVRIWHPGGFICLFGPGTGPRAVDLSRDGRVLLAGLASDGPGTTVYSQLATVPTRAIGGGGPSRTIYRSDLSSSERVIFQTRFSPSGTHVGFLGARSTGSSGDWSEDYEDWRASYIPDQTSFSNFENVVLQPHPSEAVWPLRFEWR